MDERNAEGQTASALALMYGHTKVARLIDARCPRARAGRPPPFIGPPSGPWPPSDP